MNSLSVAIYFFGEIILHLINVVYLHSKCEINEKCTFTAISARVTLFLSTKTDENP